MEKYKTTFFKSLALLQLPITFIGLAYLDWLKWQTKSFDWLSPLFYLFYFFAISIMIAFFTYLFSEEEKDSFKKEEQHNEKPTFTIVE